MLDQRRLVKVRRCDEKMEFWWFKSICGVSVSHRSHGSRAKDKIQEKCLKKKMAGIWDKQRTILNLEVVKSD